MEQWCWTLARDGRRWGEPDGEPVRHKTATADAPGRTGGKTGVGKPVFKQKKAYGQQDSKTLVSLNKSHRVVATLVGETLGTLRSNNKLFCVRTPRATSQCRRAWSVVFSCKLAAAQRRTVIFALIIISTSLGVPRIHRFAHIARHLTTALHWFQAELGG